MVVGYDGKLGFPADLVDPDCHLASAVNNVLREKEWAKPDGSVKRCFKEKLSAERLLAPRVAKDALHELATRDDVYQELQSRLS